ncbi:MAG: Transcriptional regulator, GntR family domain / Aspartate aminotransferase, partial [uncultured Solirubrobacteraceae bacterium]
VNVVRSRSVRPAARPVRAGDPPAGRPPGRADRRGSARTGCAPAEHASTGRVGAHQSPDRRARLPPAGRHGLRHGGGRQRDVRPPPPADQPRTGFRRLAPRPPPAAPSLLRRPDAGAGDGGRPRPGRHPVRRRVPRPGAVAVARKM